MTEPTEANDEWTRLLLRVVSAGQGALEVALAPGGVVETVAGAIAGILDDINSPEIRANLGEAGAALRRAWAGLTAGLTGEPVSPAGDDVPSD